jgi:flagellar motor switch protein FliN/FliY
MDQSEIDALMQGISGESVAPKEGEKDDSTLGWDDVQEELEKSRRPTAGASEGPAAEVSIPQFAEIPKSPPSGEKIDLNFILDIPLTVNVELGRNRMLIGELLQLGQGSVIELTKMAGEPMDVYVNNRLMARGEVVVVNEKFGVRLTDIISPAERINRLK